MTRAGPFLAIFLFLAAPALAQTDAPTPSSDAAGASQSTPAPEGTQPPADGVSADVSRVRADFRARFVDYDERLAALERRIEALEKELVADGEADAEVPTDSSSATMTPQDDTTSGDTGSGSGSN